MSDLIEKQERVVRRLKEELGPLKHKEAETRRLWTLAYSKYNTAVRTLGERRKKGLTTDSIKDGKSNKSVQKLWEALDGWPERSVELTKARDAAREALAKQERLIIEEESRLKELVQTIASEAEKNDGLLEKVFLLNGGVVSALELLDTVLNSDVFPLLNKKATQKTLENTASTLRLVIMTNSNNIMDVAKVEEAKQCIDAFFHRINPDRHQEPKDDTLAMLTSLLQELLVVKIRAKAGPSLSKFLALDLDREKFPELKQAQVLLASATNYTRSGMYVRLWRRDKPTDPWQPVRQS